MAAEDFDPKAQALTFTAWKLRVEKSQQRRCAYVSRVPSVEVEKPLVSTVPKKRVHSLASVDACGGKYVQYVSLPGQF